MYVSMELGPLLERCPHFRGWYVQASMKLGPEDVSLLERCPHFRGWYVQASMELGPEDLSLFSLQDEMTALMHAAYKGNIEACRKLLEHGADVNWHGHKDGVS